MKISSIILTLAAMLGTSLAWANGYPAAPVAAPAASATATGGHGGQGFGGSAGASSGSTAMGGSAGASAGASAGGGLAAAETGSVLDASNNSSKYLSFSMPQPVWTAVPTAFGCLVTESKAGSIGWSFASGSKTTQYSDVVCTTIRMAEAANLHCQFASAGYLNKRAFELMYPGLDGDFFLSEVPKNLGPVECEDLKRPKLQPTPALAPQPVAAPVTVACPAPTAPARSVPTRRAPVKKQPNTCTN